MTRPSGHYDPSLTDAWLVVVLPAQPRGPHPSAGSVTRGHLPIRSRDSGDWASSSATRRAMFGAETSSTCTRLACSRGPCLATGTSDDSQAEAESTARRPKATCELTDQEREAPCGTSPRTGSFSTWMYLPPAVRDAITLITDIAAASIKTTTKTATSAPRSVRGWSRSGCTRGRPQTGYALGESRPPGLRWSLRCPE